MNRDLIVRATKGDREALASLIELDQAPLYRFLRRRLGDSEAPDAAQDVVTRVLSGLASLRDPDAYRGWLFGIALRVVQERSRSIARERRMARTLYERDRENNMRHSSGSEIHTRVTAALDELEENLRTTILLRYEQDLSYEEIAEATGRPVGTVSKRLHTAHQKLQGMLAATGLAIGMGVLTDALGATSADAVPAGTALALRRLVLGSSPGRPESIRASAGRSSHLKILVLGLPLVLVGMLAVLGTTRGSPRIAAVPPGEPARRLPVPPPPRPEGAPAAAAPVFPAPVPSELPPTTVLVGTVRDRDTKLPIPGAKVWLEFAQAWIPPVLTDKSGAFRLETRPAKEGFEEFPYYIDAVAPGYVRRRVVRQIESVTVTKSLAIPKALPELGPILNTTVGEKEDEAGKVLLSPGTVKVSTIELIRGTRVLGRVLDQAGRPLAGVSVTVECQEVLPEPLQEDVGALGYPPVPDGSTSTFKSDFRGVFAIPNLYPRGTCQLSLVQKGFVPLRKTVAVTVSPAEETFVLASGMDLGGQVRNVQGQPVAGARVFALSPIAKRFVAAAAPSSKDGVFSLSDLPVETKFLVASLPGHGISVVDLSGKGARSIDIVLQEAREAVSGRVVGQGGVALEEATLRVLGYDFSLGEDRVRISFQAQGGVPEASGADGDLPLGATRIEAYLPMSWAPPAATSAGGGVFQLQKLAIGPGVEALLFAQKDGYASVSQRVSQGDLSGPISLRKLPP